MEKKEEEKDYQYWDKESVRMLEEERMPATLPLSGVRVVMCTSCRCTFCLCTVKTADIKIPKTYFDLMTFPIVSIRKT